MVDVCRGVKEDRSMHQIATLCLLVLLPTLKACTINTPVAIQHVVLIKLQNPDQQLALIDDCNRLLPGIDGVSTYWCGTPDQSGRISPTIDSNWDVALCVGYPSADAYNAYVVDPAHIELVTRWKPDFEWLRIHDVSLHPNLVNQTTIRK